MFQNLFYFWFVPRWGKWFPSLIEQKRHFLGVFPKLFSELFGKQLLMNPNFGCTAGFGTNNYQLSDNIVFRINKYSKSKIIIVSENHKSSRTKQKLAAFIGGPNSNTVFRGHVNASEVNPNVNSFRFVYAPDIAVMFSQTHGGPLNSIQFRLQKPPEFNFNDDGIITKCLPTESEDEFLNIESESPVEVIIRAEPSNGHASSGNVASKRVMPHQLVW